MKIQLNAVTIYRVKVYSGYLLTTLYYAAIGRATRAGQDRITLIVINLLAKLHRL